MSDFLVDHAIKNVWCTPYQDYQVRFKPTKVSQPQGDRYYTTIMGQRLRLPNDTNTFYVYQIGQVHPSLYNLFDEERRWFALSKIMRTNHVMIDLYTDSGYQYPRFESYMLHAPDGNLLIAIAHQPTIPKSLKDNDFYIRLYSNAYFSSIRSETNTRVLYSHGKHIKTTVDIVNMQNTFASYKALAVGTTYAIINGVFSNTLNALTMAIGDVVEFVYDSTVKNVIEIPVASMETFQSTLDSVEKYLLHKASFVSDTIEYHDDIDFFVIRTINNIKKGVILNRNRSEAVRMITHKDYAIPTATVDNHVSQVPFFDNVNQLTIRLHVRHSGYHRPLVDEHHRIKELYKLTDAEVIRAMMGLDSTIPEWKAEALEESDYTRIMRQYGLYITKDVVTSAYGYNAISNLVGQSPLDTFLDTGTLVVTLPIGFVNGATVYEYTSAGLLLGFYNHNGGSYYPARNANAAFVEAFVGVGTRSLGMDIGKHISGRVAGTGYRFYKATKIDGVVTGDYVDVTGSADYTTTDLQFIWNVNPATTQSLVRRDDRFLAYSFTMQPTDQLLRFNITSQETVDNVSVTRNVAFPTARLDLWLNNRPLIENVDFHVKWPSVVIINKNYREQSGPQTITVRAYGHPTSSLERDTPKEWGFVSYGVLSRNNRFDIRDDKVMRFVVGGSVKRRSAITFQEDTNALIVNSSLNGKPYLIWDQIVPIQNFASQDTYALRAISLELDKRISDYLTLKKPEPIPVSPSTVPSLYPLVSPFCAKVLADVLSGVIEPSFYQSVYSAQTMTTRLAPYMELLDFDPTQPHTLYDADNCIVHPHAGYTPIQLTLFQWQFIQKVIEVFLYNRIDTTMYLTVEVL